MAARAEGQLELTSHEIIWLWEHTWGPFPEDTLTLEDAMAALILHLGADSICEVLIHELGIPIRHCLDDGAGAGQECASARVPVDSA